MTTRLRLAVGRRGASELEAPDLGAHGFSTERERLGGALRFARGFKKKAHALGAHGFSTERARLGGALRFARGFKKSACYLWGF